MYESQVNFVRQQGFEAASAQTCDFQYPALMFQPRLIGLVVLAGVLLQAPAVFLALSAVLWWSVLVPALNPFDAIHNAFIARRKAVPFLTPAPAPRRFAQAMAATFMLLIGVSLLAGWNVLAWILQALLLAALTALILGRFCLGSFLFYVCTGKGRFARQTLPWVRGA